MTDVTLVENEKKYRINIKQSAAGFSYFEITIRGDTKEEVEKLLDEAISIAKKKCEELNKK